MKSHTTCRKTQIALLVAMACALPATAQQKRLSDDTAKRFHVFPQIADGSIPLC